VAMAKANRVRRYLSGAALIGTRIRMARKRRGPKWSQQNLVDRVDAWYSKRGLESTWDYSALSRVETGASDARRLTDMDIEAFADVLEVSRPWLLGWDEEKSVLPWEALSDPRYAQDFGRHLAEVQHGADEFLGWASFLPCSIEPPDFMERHHELLFGKHRPSLSGRSIEIALKNYNDIGHTRRKQLEESARTRSWRFRHIMFHADLYAIAAGEDLYGEVSPALRAKCFNNLIRLITNDDMRVDLLVVTPEELRSTVEFADTLVCIDTRFVFWRDRQGSVHSSSDAAMVKANRRLLESLEAQAEHSRPAVVGLLQDLEREALRKPWPRTQ
jgi:hypothetical protein